MDLETVENKLLQREYKNKFDFIDDMNLIFLNCLEYNGWNSGKCIAYYLKAMKQC